MNRIPRGSPGTYCALVRLLRQWLQPPTASGARARSPRLRRQRRTPGARAPGAVSAAAQRVTICGGVRRAIVAMQRSRCISNSQFRGRWRGAASSGDATDRRWPAGGARLIARWHRQGRLTASLQLLADRQRTLTGGVPHPIQVGHETRWHAHLTDSRPLQVVGGRTPGSAGEPGGCWWLWSFAPGQCTACSINYSPRKAQRLPGPSMAL